VRFLRLLLAAAAYFAAAKVGLSVASAAEQVTLVWPPTGLALAAIVIVGSDIWPGIALGAFLANVTAHEPVLTAAGVAAGK
jgi:integral membrane sensor domain MASE1